MQSKLNLDMATVERARSRARRIAAQTQRLIDRHTSVAVERTVIRLLGVDGVDESGVPLPNVVVSAIQRCGWLPLGAAAWLGNAARRTGLDFNQIAHSIATGDLDPRTLPPDRLEEAHRAVAAPARAAVDRIAANRAHREILLQKYGDKSSPLLYVIVATGNIHEDIVQARAAAKQGADVVAVIRTTGQSLLDYVPYGATTEGFGGTYATQENFRLMRQALDDEGEVLCRYIRLCNYCSGLCMPEIAAMGAFERLDVMLNDALYGILFRDINMQRTMIDQYFSRIINGFAGVIINTGEDNYLTTDDAFESAHTVLASQLINEQFALLAGLPEEQMGLGHAFEMDPHMENAFLYELAQAQMAREVFPRAPLKYMPPTKFMTGNIFRGHVQNALFNMVTVLTGQRINLLGMLTEAIHTPFMSDRYLAIENAQYIFRTMKDLGEEITFRPGGIMEERAHLVLAGADTLLAEIEQEGLFRTLEKGKFAGVRRSVEGGKGLEGVVEKDPAYYNPFIDLMLLRPGERGLVATVGVEMGMGMDMDRGMDAGAAGETESTPELGEASAEKRGGMQ